MAVGGDVANGILASKWAGLVVDGETELGRLALGEAKAVVARAAGHDLGWQAGYSANLASDVGDVVASKLETSVLNAVILAEVELANVDVLVLGWIRSAAAVCRVGAAS